MHKQVRGYRYRVLLWPGSQQRESGSPFVPSEPEPLSTEGFKVWGLARKTPQAMEYSMGKFHCLRILAQ
jgi:hypothetical protein